MPRGSDVFARVRTAFASMGERDEILGANAAYYRAFAAGDFAAMSRIWAEEQVSCIHPGWPVLVGRSAVLESWRNILRDPAMERIECLDATAIVSGDEGRVLCVEIVGATPFAASNWFRRIGGAWRMIHHHASPIALQAEDDAPEPVPRRLN